MEIYNKIVYHGVYGTKLVSASALGGKKMKLLAQKDKYGAIDSHVGRRNHQVIKIYEESNTRLYYTVSYQREEIYNSLSNDHTFSSIESATANAMEWVDTKSPVTLRRQSEIEDENVHVSRFREQIRLENEKRPAVKKEIPPEVMEKRKIRRKVKRKINRWIHSHDKN